ncbi:MAG: sulfate adenylyltransferase [Megasphaera sp.]|jgi:sulfate adenylyltransferase subunit 1|nr:sulfate adenylyltransferase [Megasphaera sp.]
MDRNQNGLVKFITCGSVDDGKSTLIGHLLYDAKLLYADQKRALELESKVGSRGGAIDYSLLLDGLMAEREQGITIDVAYRYFSTDNRSFIVADTPGHEEYTRNMAVGASFADVAIILIDATKGVLVQTRRHARICSLMGIRYFVFAINKMDLADYSKERFAAITEEIRALQDELGLAHVLFIPVSATEGDNVTKPSQHMPWYDGPTILGYLETVNVEEQEEEGFYLPIQRVCRPNHTFRGFQGQIESGTIHVGDSILTLPNREKATVKSILIGFDSVETASKGQPVNMQLDREVDVSRGCVFTKDTDVALSQRVTATLLWMDDEELVVGKEYVVKVGTKEIVGVLTDIDYTIDVNTGEKKKAATLKKNEIALCTLFLQEPIVVDTFSHHKGLGELILIDRVTNMTSACGVIIDVHDTNGDHTFVQGSLKGRGDIFEDFFYGMESMNITKAKPPFTQYTMGNRIPVRGETYSYPESFDILILRDRIAVEIRQEKVARILPLKEYAYTGYPLVNGRGFAIRVHTREDYDAFMHDYEQSGTTAAASVFDKWLNFDTYRTIKFHNNFK